MTEYVYRPTSGTFAFECLTCGALVGDQDLHNEWHADVASVAAKARSADAFTRPIG